MKKILERRGSLLATTPETLRLKNDLPFYRCALVTKTLSFA